MLLPTFNTDSINGDLERLEVPRVLAAPQSVRTRGWSLLSDSVQDVPSWLTSFVVHLLCFLLLMSVTSRPSSSTGGAPLVLQLSLGEELESTSVMEVTEPQSQKKNGETNDLPDGRESSDRPPPPAESRSSESPSQESRSERRTALRFPTGAPTAAPSKYAALTMRLRNRSTSTETYSSVENRSNDPFQQRFDTVVDRFIQYDIGKLGGEEGLQANREFHRLGAEAFPALVRGLNRSANLHASCPVGVIAGKILSVLRNSGDPSLAGYAAKHIGEGVSNSAPHFSRIIALRDRYVGSIEVIPSRVSEMLSERGLAGEGETFELALGLADSPVQTLAAALRSADEDLALPATIALLQRLPRLSKSEKSQALRTLGAKDMENATEDYKSIVQDSIAALQTDLAAMQRRRNASDRSRHVFGDRINTNPLIPGSGPEQVQPAPHRAPANPYQRPY